MSNENYIEVYLGGNQSITEVRVELSQQAFDELIEEEFDGLCRICKIRVQGQRKICLSCLLDELEDYGPEAAQDVREMFGG